MPETFTRGPWKAEGPVRDSHTGAPAIEIGAETPKGHLSVAWVFGLYPGEDLGAAWADARLLALAPELVDALRELDPANGARTDCNERKCGACSTCRARALLARVSP